MTKSHRTHASLVTFVLVCSVLVPAPRSGRAGDGRGAWPQRYLEAVKDAQTATPAEISRNLVAIGKATNRIRVRWDGEPDRSRVLVLTWTGKPYYDGYVGRDYVLPLDANIWVTVVPELKSFAASHGGDVSVRRVEQLLGLPPESGKDRFVEIWVHPIDLFRPSPDPEVGDHEAEVEFRDGNSRFVTLNDGASIVEWDSELGRDVTYTYREWFTHRTNTIYSGAYPYPWTRLGYTYDWGKSKNHVGLSELVIVGGSTIGIKSVTVNHEYLQSVPASTSR